MTVNATDATLPAQRRRWIERRSVYPSERRRRAVKHGRRALDALDDLKLGLLSGTLDQGTLLRLKSAAADLRVGSGDEKLDQVLAEIDLRVAVELAKAGIA